MSQLKDQLIKLGTKNPKLRKHLRPILDEMSKKAGGRGVAVEIAQDLERKSPSGLDLSIRDVNAPRSMGGTAPTMAEVDMDASHPRAGEGTLNFYVDMYGDGSMLVEVSLVLDRKDIFDDVVDARNVREAVKRISRLIDKNL